jgi:hypothetical protein
MGAHRASDIGYRGRGPMRKSWLVAALCAVVFAAMSASSAFAGEVTGNGKVTGAVANANSICAYSGQNDRVVGEGPIDTRVQTPAEGPPGAPGKGTCAGGSNHNRDK